MTNWGTENPFGSEQPETPPMTYGTPAGGNYGYPPSSSGTPGNHPSGPPKSKGQSNTLATLSLIFAFVLPPAGAVLGHLALSQIKKHPQPGRRQAVIGTILSYAMTVILAVALVVWLVLGHGQGTGSTASSRGTSTTEQSTAPWVELPFTGVEPSDVAVAADGTVYATDPRTNRVLSLAPGSTSQSELPFTGLSYPTGVAVGADGTIYVTGRYTEKVLSLAPGSTSQSELPFTGLNHPRGVAVGTDGSLYVTDDGNDRALSLAPGSTSQSVLPFTGLSSPQGVAVGADGSIYVATSNKVFKLPVA